MINTTWLRTFCTLVEVDHFTRTAERLHMTQSGVSQQVRKLEDQLGLPLLFREGKQFTLTDAGERLYREGRAILFALQNLEQALGEDPADEGLVRVMSPGSVGLRLYPHLLALQQRHPGLAIDYRFAPNADVESAIADDRADIGFMTRASAREEVACQPVAEEALLLVTPASIRKPDWQRLTELGFIDHPDGAHHAGLLLGANFSEFENSGMFTTRGFSNQIGLILEPVSRGLGFTVLPAYAVEAFPRPKRISVHRLAKPVTETVYRCSRHKKPVPRRVETVIEEAGKWL
ncbi:LysR family transcriptional regulator [Microbulbifer litoralis]|uniref:LysR family transcriptional regulator n=1 Tax=Microbulbifer litoralis TaxID=2933965 RepID=UPI002027CA80|nr:LysR family transcriptional regulator [Microbulbifer sp. GX H0434]